MNTPTPRTDNHVRVYQTAGNLAAYTVMLSHARQLERELNESQLWVKASMESAAIASSTIAGLETERDTLRKMSSDTWQPAATLPPVVEDSGMYTKSAEHLVFNGKEVFIAYHLVWLNPETGAPEWRRGDWHAGKVTHWQPLPQPPGGAK